jgi:hypothetical protein
MKPKDLPPEVKERMFSQGAVIVFGPTYLNTTLAMQEQLAGQLVLSCERIDNLNIPSTLMLYCLMIFSHYLPNCKGRRVRDDDLQKWSSRFLKDITFRAATPLDTVPAEFASQEPEEKSLVGDETGDGVVLIVRWGPVESSHCIEVARALERSYERNGGYYRIP